MAGFEWSGLDQFEALLEKAIAQHRELLGRAMYEWAQVILRDTLPVTPIEYGTLRASGHVTFPAYPSTTIVEVTIGFGGPAAPYAIYVHENPEAYHRPPTRSKFLESTFLDAAGHAEQELAARMKTLFGG